MNRRDQLKTVEVGRRDLQRRTESLFGGWTVNDGPGRTLRMIVSGRDSGIGMVAYKLMMMVLHYLVVVPETIRPSRNWPAEQEKKTKQRDEEALHESSFQMRPELN